MGRPSLSSARQRLTAAKLSGLVERLVSGALRGTPTDEAVTRLHDISTEPVVLGHVLGPYLVRAEQMETYAAAVELLRAAGADELVASEVAEWLRARYPGEVL
jgi:hypothetical protein